MRKNNKKPLVMYVMPALSGEVDKVADAFGISRTVAAAALVRLGLRTFYERTKKEISL